MSFDSYNCLLKIQKSIDTSTPKVGAHLGVWKVHSLTLSCIPRNMKCDPQTSFLARTFENPRFGHEPKVKVVTHLFLGAI
jgi:hypothetical protein